MLGVSASDLASAQVLEAFPNTTCRITAGGGSSPNDPLLPFQKHLAVHDAPRAWAFQPDAHGIVVAILDTGVAYENWSDASGDYRQASDLAGTSFTPGWDFVNGDAHPNDDNHHGTFIAGIVSQTTNNAVGAAGLARGATIMPIKVLDASGNGTLANVIAGIEFAADAGADVILMSFAFPSGQDPGSPLDDALAYARQSGALLVGASGNEGKPDVSFPAASVHCIAVGAARSSTGAAINRTRYSNWGTALDLIAFGGDAADRDGDGEPDAPLAQAFAPGNPLTESYYFVGGTSAAAASVAGTAALLLAAGQSPEEAEGTLFATTKDLEKPGFDTATGFGLLDPGAALLAASLGTSVGLGYQVNVVLSLELAGPQRARLVADIEAFDPTGAPASKVRVFVHFRGEFAAMSGDDLTTPQGKAKITSDWLDISGIDPGTWIPGLHYNVRVDRVVKSANRHDPNSEANVDPAPGSDVIIDTPIKDH